MKVSRQNGVAVVELGAAYDSLDDLAIERLRDILGELTTDFAGSEAIVLDLSQTGSIGSRFVGLLFAAQKRLRQQRRRLGVCGANQHCADVLAVVRSDQMFGMFATREEALQALGSAVAGSGPGVEV